MNEHIWIDRDDERAPGPEHGRRGARRRLVPLVVATGLAVTASPAVAAPTKIGPVKGLDLSISKPADQYVVASDWDDLAGATAYRVTLTSGGTVVQSGKVTASDWTTTTTLGAGVRVTLKVVPLAGKRPGRPASVNEDLPDLTAPYGEFEVVQGTPGSRTVTINQISLSDDVTPAGSIVRTINWDDGTPAGNTLSHTYAEDLRAYHPTITLTDAAGNPRPVSLGTVVVGDQTAPTGSFEATSNGWSGWTRVALTETTPVDDNFSTADQVTRTVEWGDGTTDTWTGGTAPTHVYTSANTYTPTITLADEAGNDAVTTANDVTVTADTDRPTVSLRKPAARRTWVRSWVTLRGKAGDAATGVSRAQLRLVEKRGTAWYSYLGKTRRWVRGGKTQAAALRRTTPANVRPSDNGRWSCKVSGLRKGQLVVRVRAVDNVRNKSAYRAVKQTLTHN